MGQGQTNDKDVGWYICFMQSDCERLPKHRLVMCLDSTWASLHVCNTFGGFSISNWNFAFPILYKVVSDYVS